MHVYIDVKDINWTHRIAAKTEKRWPIIAKIARCWERSKVINNSKKRLKGKTLSITESLSKLWMGKLRAARDEWGFRNV